MPFKNRIGYPILSHFSKFLSHLVPDLVLPQINHFCLIFIDSALLLLSAGGDPMILSKYGDDVLQTACLKGSLHVFNHLLETVFYDPARIAESFELIGTTFLVDFHDIGSTLFFWRKALEIRYEGTYRHYPKVIDHDRVHEVLGVREFDNKEELDDLHGDPSAMKIQALLITERVLGAGHKDTIFRLVSNVIRSERFTLDEIV